MSKYLEEAPPSRRPRVRRKPRAVCHIFLIHPSRSLLCTSTAPLPYYALSNLLTLFSHDVPTLPLIQHIFDYLLSRPPIVVVYLAAAVRIPIPFYVSFPQNNSKSMFMTAHTHSPRRSTSSLRRRRRRQGRQLVIRSSASFFCPSLPQQVDKPRRWCHLP